MEPKVITTGTLNPEANIRGGGKPLMSSLKICPVRKPEPEFENLLRSPGIDSQPGGIDPWLQIQALLYKREGAGGVTPLPLTTTLFPSWSANISCKDDVTVILLLVFFHAWTTRNEGATLYRYTLYSIIYRVVGLPPRYGMVYGVEFRPRLHFHNPYIYNLPPPLTICFVAKYCGFQQLCANKSYVKSWSVRIISPIPRFPRWCREGEDIVKIPSSTAPVQISWRGKGKGEGAKSYHTTMRKSGPL